MKTLILYSSKDGHTTKICQFLQKVIEEQEDETTLISVEDASDINLQDFDKVIIGASIHYGKHSPLISNFINTNAALLDTLPNAFFSVNLVARKPEKRDPETNPYLNKFLKQISWKPGELAVFAGKLDYPRYNFRDRLMIRMIMWMTGGPTDRNAVVEFTDWKQVEAFGRLVGQMRRSPTTPT
ncbi:MAG: menaquinone-dependent protoporphyrinogen IX dehydrogenase [Pseudomonadota bacterium]|nr:menaquinone-dependent protoporphyrinogen IX dehydrogenase [Pseudomonadota bacterium]